MDRISIGSINVEEIDDEESGFYQISIGCAYHLHNAAERRYEESYLENEKLARYASNIGDLDLAERCYKRAIDDSEQLVGHIDYKHTRTRTTKEVTAFYVCKQNVRTTVPTDQAAENNNWRARLARG
jgi:hypothetical protein